EIDVVGAGLEAQIDAVMDKPLTAHSLADPCFVEQIDGVLFEKPGADALLAVFAAARFQDHGFNAAEMQQMPQHQTGGPGAHDADPGAYPAQVLLGSLRYGARSAR